MEITKMNKTLYHLKILFFFYYRHIHTLPFFSFYNIKNYIIIIQRVKVLWGQDVYRVKAFAMGNKKKCNKIKQNEFFLLEKSNNIIME